MATKQKKKADPRFSTSPTSRLNPQTLCHKQVLEGGEIITLMVYSGFPPRPHVLAEGLAVAHCESNFGANRGPSSAGAVGLWQIGTTAASGSHTNATTANDNCKSTKIAHQLWRAAGGSFDSDWAASASCWKPLVPQYEAYIKTGDISKLVHGASAADFATGAVGDAAGAVGKALDKVNPIGDIVKLLARLFEPDFWLRVGKAALGFTMLLFGIAALSKALLGVDLGSYAEGFAGTIGGKRLKGARVGVRPRRSRTRGYSTEELERRAEAQQRGRERAKSSGEQGRRKKFFEDVNESEVPF